MKKNFKKVALLTAVLALAIFGFAGTAFARTVGISPLVFEMTAEGGDVLENHVKILNPSEDTTVKVEMQVEDIRPTGEAGHVTVEPADSLPYSIAQWVTVEPEELELEPREERYVKFTIEVPEIVEPGGHYGTILASTTAAHGPEETGVAIRARTGSLVLVTVPGETKRDMEIVDFSAPGYLEKGPVPFEMMFQNLGNVHFRPTAKVTVTNWLGQEVGVAEIEPKNVLPGGQRKFTTELPQEWLWAGRYTATLTGSYGENVNFGPRRITFWAFPWKVGLALLVVLILIFLIRKRLKVAFKILFQGEKALTESSDGSTVHSE